MVGIAVGTVLLPEMSRRLAAGDVRGAASAQARGIQLALLLTVPCAAAAIAVPDLIMRALFARGAFTIANAAAAGANSRRICDLDCCPWLCCVASPRHSMPAATP